jgi:DNA-binding phage protein
MTAETRAFDPAAYLDSHEPTPAYLDGAFADGDAGETADDPRDLRGVIASPN